MKERGRSLIAKIKLPLAIVAICTLLTFEGLWRFRIEGGPEEVSASKIVRNDKYVRRSVGDILSVDLRRYRSAFMWDIGGGRHGRFHFFVKGTRGEMNVLVTWHDNEPAPLVVDKIKEIL